MLHVALDPPEASADNPIDMALSIANEGPGTCTNIVLTLQLPVELALLRGRRQIRISRLDERQTVVHTIQVQARQAGDFVLQCNSFSYYDPSGRVVQATPLAFPLRVGQPALAGPFAELVVEIAWHAHTFRMGEWDGLSGTIYHENPDPVDSVTIAAEGPLISNPITIESLPAAERTPFTLKVCPNQAGAMVPVGLLVTFRYGPHHNGRTLIEGSLKVDAAAPHAGLVFVEGDFIQSGAKKIGGDEISGHAQIGDRVEMRRDSSIGATEPFLCPNCGESLRPGNNYCPACGTKVRG